MNKHIYEVHILNGPSPRTVLFCENMRLARKRAVEVSATIEQGCTVDIVKVRYLREGDPIRTRIVRRGNSHRFVVISRYSENGHTLQLF